MSITDFWLVSLADIQDYIESYERRHKREFKQRISELHFLTKDIAHYIGIVLNGSDGNPIPELWDYFPDLFDKEKKEADKRLRDHQMAVYKAQMQDYVYRHNRSRNGGEKP